METILNGDRQSLARLLTQVENGTSAGLAALDQLFPHTGRAHLIGVTGAPGTGKSSLVNRMALEVRRASNPKTVAIVAVDPSSPFTRGAILGDRVRMRDLAGDAGVFIRSMASRGSLGGLAQATAAVVQVFDAAGFDLVFIETVGAGQTEVDIARLAQTTIVVETPGLGDEIQAIKAGILEIADILVVNKADLPGVESAENALHAMLSIAAPHQKALLHHGEAMTASAITVEKTRAWEVPILRTVATDGSGVGAVLASVEAHASHLRRSEEWGQRERLRLETEFETLLAETLMDNFRVGLPRGRYQRIIDRLVQRKLSPRQAVKALLK